jgi:hypothetical protein
LRTNCCEIASPNPVPPYSRVVLASAWAKALEQARLLLGLMPRPLSSTVKRSAQLAVVFFIVRCAGRFDAQFNVAARGELQRIADQVDQYLAQTQRIAQQLRRQLGRGPDHQLQPAFGGTPGEQVADLVQRVGRSKGRASSSSLPDSIFEKSNTSSMMLQQALTSAADLAEVVQRLRRQFEVRAQAGEAEDGVHRRADLMADVGQEFALGTGGRFGVGARLLDHAHRPRFLIRGDERLL